MNLTGVINGSALGALTELTVLYVFLVLCNSETEILAKISSGVQLLYILVN